MSGHKKPGLRRGLRAGQVRVLASIQLQALLLLLDAQPSLHVLLCTDPFPCWTPGCGGRRAHARMRMCVAALRPQNPRGQVGQRLPCTPDPESGVDTPRTPPRFFLPWIPDGIVLFVPVQGQNPNF